MLNGADWIPQSLVAEDFLQAKTPPIRNFVSRITSPPANCEMNLLPQIHTNETQTRKRFPFLYLRKSVSFCG
jgi:hypothetical protein